VKLLFPGKLRDGNSAIADHDFRPFSSTVCEEIQMAFVNEVVSDADIAKYNLPFKPGSGRYWTRDKERDCYLWGGIIENFARDYEPEGRFWLSIRETLLDVSLNVLNDSRVAKNNPPALVWEEVSHIQPSDLGGLDIKEVMSVLKEALMMFGRDGENAQGSSGSVVIFRF